MTVFSKIKNNATPEVLSTLANSVWAIVRGPIMLLLIPLFLSDIDQGFWFTFGSIAAFSVLANLGFTTIIAQFSAHEYAYLKFNKEGELEGDAAHLDRIVSLFRFIFKWVSFIVVIAFPIILLVGGFILNTHGNIGDWIIPWIIYVIVSGGNFFVSFFLCFFEGCDKITKIQLSRFVASVVTTVAQIVLLVLDFSLYALAISALLGLIANVFLLGFGFKKAIVQMFKHKLGHKCQWMKEFMQLFWRYALNTIAGFLIFQIFTPITFIMFGPVEAGRVGITLALVQACFSIAMVWIGVISPRMNMAAAKGEWKTMDRLLYKNLSLSLVTYVIGGVSILGGYAILINHWSILERFLPLLPLGILVLTYFLQVIIGGTAVYGRAHKIEPYMVPALVSSAISLIVTFISVFLLPIEFIFLGFLVSNIVNVTIMIVLHFTRRQIWHELYEKKYLNPEEESHMTFTKTKLAGVVEIDLKSFGDNRGWFSEVYNKELFDKNGLRYAFVQDNHSYSATKGTVRGLHLQNAPYAQSKLVRCVRGAIFDVAVDLRLDSATYKQWVGVELSAENKKMLMIPRGFAHGFVTLTDDAEVVYKVDNHYNKESEVGILFDDPDIGVEWNVENPVLSDKDKDAKLLADCAIMWDTPPIGDPPSSPIPAEPLYDTQTADAPLDPFIHQTPSPTPKKNKKGGR